MGPLECRKTPAMYRSHRKCSTAINRGEITRELPLAWYLPTTIRTGAFFVDHLRFPSSLPPALECHHSVGGFNAAFNPHRLIITLTFTLHSIKFLTADLLQWLFVLQKVAVITRVMGSLRFNAASDGKYSGKTVFWKGRAEFGCPETERHRKGQKYYYIKYETTWVQEVEQHCLSRLYCSGYYHNCWGIVETGR